MKNQIQPTRYHRRPITSIIHMQYRTLHKEKTGMHDGHPHVVPYKGGGFVQDLAKPRKISQYLSPSRRKHARYRTKNQWSSDSAMDLDDELPRIQNQLECIRNPVAVKQRRQDTPVPVTEDWFGPVTRQNKQSTHQTMMKKCWNRCPTQKTR